MALHCPIKKNLSAIIINSSYHRHQQSTPTATEHHSYRKKYYSHQYTGLTDAIRIYIVYIGPEKFVFGWENVSISFL